MPHRYLIVSLEPLILTLVIFAIFATVIPECREPRNMTVSVTATEDVRLDCVVESNPEEVSRPQVFLTKSKKKNLNRLLSEFAWLSSLQFVLKITSHSRKGLWLLFCLESIISRTLTGIPFLSFLPGAWSLDCLTVVRFCRPVSQSISKSTSQLLRQAGRHSVN